MEKTTIKKISDQKIHSKNLSETKGKLENFEISFGKYEVSDLKKALINDKKPFFIPGHFIVGYKGNDIFSSDEGNEVRLQRPTDAIIVESENKTSPEPVQQQRDPFIIMGQDKWQAVPAEMPILQKLFVGEPFLPPHSVILNLMEQTEKEKKEKIVSALAGVNIEMYSPDRFLDNVFHEIGHLFWRTCVRADEKEAFQGIFENLKMSAIYEYEWERSDVEEFFCTIYKWYMKSLFINNAFMNILEHEEPKGFALFKEILDRISKDRILNATWEINQKAIKNYFHPRQDVSTGRFVRSAEDSEVVKNTIVPDSAKIVKLEKGVEYRQGGKDFIIPVKNNKIMLETPMQKAASKPIVYVDMDGVVADFRAGYKQAFDRSADKDDPFTIKQFVSTVPHFFYNLPVLEKGAELVEALKDDYNIVFLTSPMDEIPECRRDKINWILDNFGVYDVIFCHDKYKHVIDDKSILIDDMGYNLKPWAEAGGTAINSSLKNSKILKTIEEAFNPEKDLKTQLDKIKVNTEPTEAQKESGNYKKGKIVFKGLDIRIENPKGSLRFGFDENGKKWITRMKHHYGYITGTEGADFDPIDCFIGDTNGSLAFVVNQNNPVSGLFGEHKIMLGFKDIEEARAAYLANYQKGWKGLGAIKQTNTKKLRKWLKEGSTQIAF